MTFICIFYHPQKAFFKFVHVALGLSKSRDDVEVLGFYLRNCLLYQFDIVVFVGT
jgi:hypothetical protein